MKKIIKNQKGLIILVIIFMVFAGGFNVYRIQGDGDYYFALLERTLSVPDPECAPDLMNTTFGQAGCVFFNIPFYMVGYAIEKNFKEKPNFNGITLRSISVNIASNFYMLLSIILVFKILKLFDFKYKAIAVFSILFSTSAFMISVVTPSYNHSVDTFLITLFIYIMLLADRDNPNKLLFFVLGGLYSIMFLVRHFNLVLIVPFIVKLLLEKKYKRSFWVVIGVISTIWIVPVIFNAYYPDSNKQGLESIHSMTNIVYTYFPLYPKYAMKLLVHPIHGLFIWSPVVILSCFGLVFLSDDNVYRKKAYMLLSMFLLMFLLYGFFPDWHAGWSFSNRYLVGLFAIYAVGLAKFLERYRRVGVALSMLFVCYSLFLFFNWYICIVHGQWGTPFDMVKAWSCGESYYFSGKTVNMGIFLERILNLCRYKYLFKLF